MYSVVNGPRDTVPQDADNERLKFPAMSLLYMYIYRCEEMADKKTFNHIDMTCNVNV